MAADLDDGSPVTDVQTDRIPNAEARRQPLKMCKYCGERIIEGWNRYGKKSRVGQYCSEQCADDAEGFDNRLESERRFKTRPIDTSFDAQCVNTQTPTEIAEGRDDRAAGMRDEETARQLDKFKKIHAAMANARAIDPRLPDILLGLAAGETQESIAKRWKMTPGRITQLKTLLHATSKGIES